MMSTTQGPGAIASNVLAILRSFQELTKPFAGSNSSSGSQSMLTAFEEEMMRFKMWSGNLGAHQSGRASLDHRLRDAPRLRDQVIYLLKDLGESLQDALTLASHQPPSWQTKNIGEASSMDHSSDSALTDSDSDSDSDSPESGLLTAQIDVGEAIDCLLRLSVAIANPAPHERVHNLGIGPSDDVSFYETFDIQRVRDKFPKISTAMAETLGKSITRRRQFFKYREAHHTKLSAGLEETLNRETDTSRTEIVSKTVASSLPDYLKTLTNIDLTADVIDEDARSETGMTQTSYATSVGVLEDANEPEKRLPPPLKVPPLPEAAKRGNFECPFCYRMISASSWRAWKRHVFGDLRPYTCIFADCIESNADFDRRHRWQLHVSQHHWRSWFYPFSCEGIFPSATELKLHIGQKHLQNAPEEQLNALAALGEKAVSDDTASTCPMCAHTVVGVKSYIKHVGRHLEQLALTALPDLQDEELEDEGGSAEQNSAASEVITDDANSSDAASTSPSLRRRIQEPEDAIVPGSGIYSFYEGTRPEDQALSESQEEEAKPRNEDAASQQHESRHVEDLDEEPGTKEDVETAGSSDVIKAITEAETSEITDSVSAELKATIARDTTVAAEPESAMSKLEERIASSKSEGEALEELNRRLAGTLSEELPPILFTDAVGRKFSFPFRLCKSWQGMQQLIRQAFFKVDILQPQVQDGHYDLIGPDDEIILPSNWEQVIQPGWAITMTMWPTFQSKSSHGSAQNNFFVPTPDTKPGILKDSSRHGQTAGKLSGTRVAKDWPGVMVPEHIRNHVSKITFRVPAQLAGKSGAEISKWVEEVKDRYGRALMAMENSKQRVAQIDKFSLNGPPCAARSVMEELQQLQMRRDEQLKIHSDASKWVNSARKQQVNLQESTQAD